MGETAAVIELVPVFGKKVDMAILEREVASIAKKYPDITFNVRIPQGQGL